MGAHYRSGAQRDVESQKADIYRDSIKSPVSPSKLKVQELINQQMIQSSKSIQTLNKDSYFADYNKKVKDILYVINNFMVTEIDTLKKDKLPAEYYHLRRNFDILYRVFKVHLV